MVSLVFLILVGLVIVLTTLLVRLQWPYKIGLLVACVLLVGFLFRPVCVPMSAETVAGFVVPIEQRTDRQLYFKVFQKKNGQWHQCKTWIARFFFS